MNKLELSYTTETLSVLLKQPLNTIFRVGSSICLDFGELVEKRSAYLTTGKKVAYRNEQHGKYALHIECNSRLKCGEEIVLAKRDVFLPNTKINNNPAFSWETFAWDIYGNNYFDEQVNRYLGDGPYLFIVKSISISRLGDMEIEFENGFVFEIFNNVSGNNESWRFFVVDDLSEHLVICGNGIEKQEGGEE